MREQNMGTDHLSVNYCPLLRMRTRLYIRFTVIGQHLHAVILLSDNTNIEHDVTLMVTELQETLNTFYRSETKVEPTWELNPVTGKWMTYIRVTMYNVRTTQKDTTETAAKLLTNLVNPMRNKGTTANMQVQRDADRIVTKLILTGYTDELRELITAAATTTGTATVEDDELTIVTEDFTVTTSTEPAANGYSHVIVTFTARARLYSDLKHVHHALCSELKIYVDIHEVTDPDAPRSTV
jgi:hypothetical protein